MVELESLDDVDMVRTRAGREDDCPEDSKSYSCECARPVLLDALGGAAIIASHWLQESGPIVDLESSDDSESLRSRPGRRHDCARGMSDMEE
jgi:hypothetical protein